MSRTITRCISAHGALSFGHEPPYVAYARVSNEAKARRIVSRARTFALQLAALVVLASPQWARADVLYGVGIARLYAQSRSGSDAHLIQVGATLPPECDSNRLYIAMEDKELFAAALATISAGRQVDLIYETGAAPKLAAGHLAGLSCRLVSIF